jgi:hypothetical protein
MAIYTKELKEGINIISIPNPKPINIDRVFPKEISGATIQRLNSQGKWVDKDTVQYESGHFKTTKYKIIHPFETLKIDLPRDVKIKWEVNFFSSSRLVMPNVDYQNGFNFPEALHLANLSHLVYENEEKIYKRLKKYYDYEDYQFYSKNENTQKDFIDNFISTIIKQEDQVIDLQYLRLSRTDEKGRNIVVIAFRGSANIADWLVNLNLKSENFLNSGNVHCGYIDEQECFEQIMQEEDLTNGSLPHLDLNDVEEINKNTKILLTGHSKGGAIATLVGIDLIANDIKKENLEVYTFGQPPFADKKFCEIWNDKINLYRLVNSNDIVPKLDNLNLFTHLGKEITLQSNEGNEHSINDYINNIIDHMNNRNFNY